MGDVGDSCGILGGRRGTPIHAVISEEVDCESVRGRVYRDIKRMFISGQVYPANGYRYCPAGLSAPRGTASRSVAEASFAWNI